MEHDRYGNYWVCGLYNSDFVRRVESYVVTKQELASSRFPLCLVRHAIREVDAALARYLNQPLYL